MIAIIDYGCGNLFSLSRSLQFLGIESKITGDADEISDADKIILPGVGAFGDAADKLRATGHAELLKKLAGEGRYILGICLGMQLLFEKSYEYGEHDGLGLLEGGVYALDEDISGLKVQHMGWNKLDIPNTALMCPRLSAGTMFTEPSFIPKKAEREDLLC